MIRFKDIILESTSDFKNWKRKNVTLRGIKNLGSDNQVYGSFGKGLYTVPLSNKSMAKEYGEIYFVVNAIPKHPKIVQSLNLAEIFRQNLISIFCKKHNKGYDRTFFDTNSGMEIEMIDMGYDGFIIKGREMVNYKPKDVKYFKTEYELENYFNSL